MNRRSFLHPRRLAAVVGQAQSALDNLTPTYEPHPPDFTLVRYSRGAMATSFEVVLPFGIASAAAEAALDEVDRLEDQLSVYRDHSQVSRLNRKAFEEEVEVEPRLFELLQLSARLTADTDGAFDITAGALIKAWGFFRGPRRVPAEEERLDVLKRVGMQHVALHAERRTVRFLRRGLELNLGSIGKGYALDRASEALLVCRTRERRPVDPSLARPAGFLLHGGHSSVYAVGSQPGSVRGWPVGIDHPWKAKERLAIIWLQDRALGTSAATFQHLEWQGRKLGHILDPRTGWPAEGMASASVVAPTAAEADALATAFLILGVDRARQYCELHPGIGGVLLPQGATEPIILGLSPAEYEIRCRAASVEA